MFGGWRRGRKKLDERFGEKKKKRCYSCGRKKLRSKKL